MKAHVKINVSIHLEDDSVGTDPQVQARLNETIKYPLAANYAGVVVVADKGEAERVITMLGNHINTTFMQMNVKPATGTHKPDLAAAFGGDQEPGVTEGNGVN